MECTPPAARPANFAPGLPHFSTGPGSEDAYFDGAWPPISATPTDTGVCHGPLNETILDAVIVFLRRFVIFQDPTHYDILAIWIIHTHAFEVAYATPYIYVKSAEPQSGKTRTIEAAELLVRTPERSANMSQGAMYAAIESRQPTVFIDEVDAIFYGKANEDLRGMLNAGYKMGGTVARQVMLKGGERDIEHYNVFCPKLLAGIDNGEIPATIADRCIAFDLKRKKRDEVVERMNYRVVRPQAEALKDRIRHWVAQHQETIATTEVADIPEISDRAFEISEPLMQIAMQFRGWTERGRDGIIHLLTQRKPTETMQTKALRVARDLFADGDRDRITAAEFAVAMDMPPARAGRLLSPYGIRSITGKVSGGTHRVYHKSDFVDAWERYL